LVTWVLFVAIFNLALGYAVSAALADPPPWLEWQQKLARRTKRRTAPPPPEVAPVLSQQTVVIEVASPASEEPPVTIASVEELPPEWLEQLAQSGIVTKSYVEASAHVIRLEVGRYREQLLTAESRARANLALGDGGALKLVADDLRFINQDWLDKQSSAVEMLAQRTGRLGEHEEVAKAVEQALLDQAAQIQAVCPQMEALDFASELDNAGQQLLGKLAMLVDSAHTLRDRMLDLLATLLRTGGQLQSLSSSVQLDYLTGVPNRIGIEGLFEAWSREDPTRSRPVCIALVDIDRFARINHRMGTRGGDRAIAAVARLLAEVIRKDRGYDRLARAGGETFLLLYGDTGPHSGLTALERVRQTIEATTFDDEGAEFEITISGGVIEAGPNESSAAICRRAQQALLFAKKAGRNRCAIDEGNGPTTLAPPQLAVQGRVVNLSRE
jgi:diguanylate cyclase (GGDEF)-like protein